MNDEQFEHAIGHFIPEIQEQMRFRDTAQREALARVEEDKHTLECRFEVSEDTLSCIRGCLRAAEGDIDRLKAQLAEVVGLLKSASQYQWQFTGDSLGTTRDREKKDAERARLLEHVGTFLARHAQAERQEAKPATFYDAIKNPPRIAPTLQQEAQGAQAGDERAAFERWAKERSWFDPQPSTKERDDSLFFYEDAVTDHNWIAWQARAALATQPAGRGAEHE